MSFLTSWLDIGGHSSTSACSKTMSNNIIESFRNSTDFSSDIRKKLTTHGKRLDESLEAFVHERITTDFDVDNDKLVTSMTKMNSSLSSLIESIGDYIPQDPEDEN
ncbi:hypothetical protein PCE1_000103 [Barthelona sp. PCE]